MNHTFSDGYRMGQGTRQRHDYPQLKQLIEDVRDYEMDDLRVAKQDIRKDLIDSSKNSSANDIINRKLVMLDEYNVEMLGIFFNTNS